MWMEEIVGQVKWTTSNHTKARSSFKEGDAVYMLGLEGSSFWKNQAMTFNKYCSQTDLKQHSVKNIQN